MHFSSNTFLVFSVVFFLISLFSAFTLVAFNKGNSGLLVNSNADDVSNWKANREQGQGKVISDEIQIKANEPKLLPKEETLNPHKLFNVLILGIDRRYASQASYRTDVMMLVTVDPKLNKVLLTSIPRDLWAGSMKINGVYVSMGYDAMKNKIKEITGLEPDRFIRIDFDALVWVVNAMGGVRVNVERTFTDTHYPNDREGNANEAKTVTFTKGEMVMDGETALIYARSRKGNNGEGSDFARMKRQQVLLKSMPDAFVSPKSIFNPFNLDDFYRVITQHIKTDMNIKDMGIVYDLLKDRNKYKVEHFVIGYDYLDHPNISSAYGGQWVLVPKNNDYSMIHEKIQSLLK